MSKTKNGDSSSCCVLSAKIEKIILTTILLIIIAVSVYFASWFAIHNDIIFHTDIARDFLLLEEVVKVKPITLIGPRSGGIPGVFHGPLWTYLNLPAFILGGGNPAIVGWFWVLLFVANFIVIYKVGSKIFNQEVGLFAAALTSIISAFSVPGFFNPFGAVLLFPLFFYFYYRFFKDGKFKDLTISILILGLVIQFQMAFGVPILVLAILSTIFWIIKQRKPLFILSFLILLVPLSTFILFDLKHDFLQVRSAMNYISGKENTGKVDKKFTDILNTRIRAIYTDGIGFITKDNKWLLYLAVVLLGASIFKVFKDKKFTDKGIFYILFFYFYVGYWATTTLYKGVMWGYYYWPFLSMIALVFSSTYYFVNKRLFYVIFLIFAIFNFNHEYKVNYKTASYFGSDGSSWQFNYQAAKKIFEDAPQEFGYYIFTADQFGYSNRYAMNFAQSQYKNKKAFPYEKRGITYLLISPSDNPTISDDWWKEQKVMITKKPDAVFKYKTGFRIEKYHLSPEDLKIPSDQNLIHNLHFR
jgi:hypothetical protein